MSKKANPQHLPVNVYLYEGRIETLLNKSLQERVCSLLNVPGCSSTAAAVVPLSLTDSRWSARGLCAQTEVLRHPVSICATLSPPVPAHVLLKLLGSPTDLAQPCLAMPTGTDTGVEHFCKWHFLFSWFIRLIQHSQKRWRVQTPLSAAGTSHSWLCHHWGSRKGRPRIKFWVFPLAARISSPSLAHHTQTVPVPCWQGHILLFEPHPLLPTQWKKHSRPLLQQWFPCDLAQVTAPQLFTQGLTSTDHWKYKTQFPGDKVPSTGIRIKDG